MRLNKQQNKVVESKPCGYTILKGIKGTGKTSAAIYRALYLKNNYSLYDDDKILILTHNKENYNFINKMYIETEEETKYDYLTFFSRKDNSAQVKHLNDLLEYYFHKYNTKFKIKYKLISQEEKKLEFLKSSLDIVKKKYPKSKILKDDYLPFFLDEIRWIKSFGIEYEQYLSVSRTGRKVEKSCGPRTLKKNSSSRQAIYRLMEIYNDKLLKNRILDYEDMILFILKHINNLDNERYSHIFIDEGERYSRLEIEFIKTLYNKKTYSSFNFIIDTGAEENPYSIIVNKGRINSKWFDDKVKRFYFKEIVKGINKVVEDKFYYMERFEYVDLRHSKAFEMMRDITNLNEVIVNNEEGEVEYNEDELNAVPVFSNIAAGAPILINPEQQDNFYIPKYWLKGMKECFILQVKGDSMINANIDDGDYIVIRRQYSAQNNEIVAVNLEGSATLKRLHIGKDEILLMPENEKYKPIPINDEGVFIIGTAVGIIKNK